VFIGRDPHPFVKKVNQFSRRPSHTENQRAKFFFLSTSAAAEVQLIEDICSQRDQNLEVFNLSKVADGTKKASYQGVGYLLVNPILVEVVDHYICKILLGI
jgi:hypothetical protein